MESKTDLDLYLRSLEHAAGEVPAILRDWESLDLDLWHEYAFQLGELIAASREMSQRATDANRGSSYQLRLARALVRISEFELAIESATGISVRRMINGPATATGL